MENQTHKKTVSITVFPNSGHHFEFIPLDDALFAEFPEFGAKCESGSYPWHAVRDAPWIRWRFGKRNEVRGMYLGIETNLGRLTRGWIYEPQRNIAGTEAENETTGNGQTAPYVFAEVTLLPRDQTQPINLTIVSAKGVDALQLDLVITWLRPIADPIDVDLVVDFGNTRTIALCLEHNQAAKGVLNAICQPVQFVDRDEEYDPLLNDQMAAAIVDSWFVLQEPLFANLEPISRHTKDDNALVMAQIDWVETQKKHFLWNKTERHAVLTKRHAQVFVDMSHAQFGKCASEALSHLELQSGGNYFMSSPKRYLWDTDPVGDLGIVGASEWTMVVNKWNPNHELVTKGMAGAQKLAGNVLRFFDEAGTDWQLGDGDDFSPPNERGDAAKRPFPDPDSPRYPRSDAMTWAALRLLETAYRQISSSRWRKLMGEDSVPRRIRSVTVTFPSGWTGRELLMYRKKWQKALDIFALTHLANRRLITDNGDRPVLRMNLDEAIASQLPIIYGEIKRLGNKGENWINLVGRGVGTDARVRVFNLDIGGGTTDMGIVEYRDHAPGGGVALIAELLFRDSSTLAGDFLVRRIIEEVLLPAIGEKIRHDDLLKSKFQSVLSAEKQNARGVWNRICLQVFIPIVRWWLTDLALDRYENPKTGSPYAPNEMLVGGTPIVSGEVLGSERGRQGYTDSTFNGLCEKEGLPPNMLAYDESIKYDARLLARCVEETFDSLFASVAKLVESFDCDVVILSGKPSELPQVHDLICKHVPLLPQRIMRAKDRSVGSWYPLSTDGVIHDAKTITVAGAALYQAIRNGLMPQWTIDRKVSPHILQRNYWGVMPSGVERDFDSVILEPDVDEISVELWIKQRIGRRLLPSESRPEPVYQLLWADRSRFKGGKENVLQRLKVTLRRVIPVAVNQEDMEPEYLEISGVSGTYGGRPVEVDDVELKLCTLDTDEYWMEGAIFNVRWSDEYAYVDTPVDPKPIKAKKLTARKY
jgi:hypothetical protein